MILTVFCNFGGFFNGLKSQRKNDIKMKLHQSIHIELKLFHAIFQNGAILSTPLFECLNYWEKNFFFILGATLDLPIINMKNQNKPNVCQSLVLQVHFKKKVLWIAGFYLFGLYNKWIPGISGDLVVKSKLPPRSGSSLEVVEPHP